MDYDISKLSPIDFEDLSCDLLKKIHRVRHIESFKIGRDNGIDLRYTHLGKNVIVQCKHYFKSGLSQLKSDLRKKELPKIVNLNPGRYILVVSVEMNPGDKNKIKTLLTPFVKETSDIISLNDIDKLLRDHDDVVKKHPKLWFTSAAILKEVLYRQFNASSIIKSEEIIRKLSERSSKYVYTSSYHKALKLLEANKVIVISGNAGIGKTTLSEMILGFLLKDGFTPIEITQNIEEARNALIKEERQVFYYDDFLGRTFSNNLNKNEDANIIKFIELITVTQNKFFLLNTREHILSNIYKVSEVFQENRFLDNKYILKLSDYNSLEKGKILYNHLYFSKMSDKYIENILKDKGYLEIINHRNYNPRIVERMCNIRNIADIDAMNYHDEFLRNLDNPGIILNESFKTQISQAARNLLIIMYLNADFWGGTPNMELEELFILYHNSFCKEHNREARSDDYIESTKELENSFIKIDIRFKGDNEYCIDYFDPSIRDFIEKYLLESSYEIKALIKLIQNFTHLKTIAGLLCSFKKNVLFIDDEIIEAIFEEEKNNYYTSYSHNLVNLLNVIAKLNNYQQSPKLEEILEQGCIFINESDVVHWKDDYNTLILTIKTSSNYREGYKNKILDMLEKKLIFAMDAAGDDASIEMFENLSKISSLKPSFFNDENLDLVRDTFCNYLEDNSTSDCSEKCDSSYAVDLFERKIEVISNRFGVSYENYVSSDEFSEIKKEKEKQEENGNDAYSIEEEEEEKDDDDDEAIINIFSSLAVRKS